jgi:hypothetical protein
VLSSTVVIRELVGTPTARAAAPAASATPATSAAATATTAPTAATAPTAPTTITTARTWALEQRWWSGEIRQPKRQAPTVSDNELTFTKGYQLRLSARQATQPATQPASPPAQIATAPTVDNQSVRTATSVRKTTTVETPTIRRVNTTQVEPSADPFARFDTGTRALSYDEQRPSTRGIGYRSTPSRGLFGTLY